jgi:hypothetical protein
MRFGIVVTPETCQSFLPSGCRWMLSNDNLLWLSLDAITIGNYVNYAEHYTSHGALRATAIFPRLKSRVSLQRVYDI